MDGSPAFPNGTSTETGTDFDAIVIGAGVSGLYQLYKLRELGLKVRVFETGTGIGGTWYWNRYPGARFDSESYSYGYSFSPELLEEWNWAERFAPQPETERYLNYVADKFDLRRAIQFNSRAAAAPYQEETRRWDITPQAGRRYGPRFPSTATRLPPARCPRKDARPFGRSSTPNPASASGKAISATSSSTARPTR